jgi:ABC-type oligopeptide transport system substrate-binding subunit
MQSIHEFKNKKVMSKKTIILSAAALAFMLGACNSSSNKNEQTNSKDSTTTQSANTSQTFNLDTTKLTSGATFYQCEMNPEVLSDKAGNCPKCGMELSEMKKQ